MASAGSEYDEVPYLAPSFANTYPDALAVAALLRGLDAPPFAGARILELGCARGANLVPMAWSMPGAEFVGVDLSRRQIEAARERAAAAATPNLTFHAMDLRDVDESFGAFDYVIAHGLFSWVPGDVQEALLEVCARRLSPNGVAYLSYNTLPGWSSGVMFREMVLYRVRGIADPSERLREARSFLRFLAGAARPKETIWAAMLDEHASYFEQERDWYLLHDDLEAENHPVYFHEMVTRAEGHGLQYVTEERSLSSGEILPPEALKELDRFATNRIEREQVVDFACNRRFRRSLFCRSGRPLPSGPTPGRLSACRLRTRLKPVDPSADPLAPGPERFVGFDGLSLESSDPRLRALLHVLYGVWPGTLDHAAAIHVLSEATRRTGGEAPAPHVLDWMVYQAVLGQLVSAHLLDPPVAGRLPDRPSVSPVARYEAADGGPVTHLLNGSSEIEPLDRFVVRLLDGTRTRDDVAEALQGAFDAGDLEPTTTGRAAEPGEAPRPAGELADLALARLLAGCYILR
ncbi:MAG: methyltransferase regulatory domain-containing protein [Thermoanaerobaculia bacterium]